MEREKLEYIRVTPADTVQFGPARIAALSIDGYPGGGNFVLGQAASSYDVRLRTTSTNQYGPPSLESPAGSLTTGLTHVVYTRDAAGTTTLYLNGSPAASDAVAGGFSSCRDYVLTLANEPPAIAVGSESCTWWRSTTGRCRRRKLSRISPPDLIWPRWLPSSFQIRRT